jgi:hypothetical protein
MHHEQDRVILGKILLVFVEITHVYSHWLLTGNRERFSDRRSGTSASPVDCVQWTGWSSPAAETFSTASAWL